MRIQWKTSLEDSRTAPSFKHLTDFLENSVHALESARTPDPMLGSQGERGNSNNHSGNQKSKFSPSTTSSGKRKKPKSECKYCSDSHALCYYTKFQDLSVPERREFVIKATLCTNCLKPGHIALGCKATQRCLVCRHNHNTLLHDDHYSQKNNTKNSNPPPHKDSTSIYVVKKSSNHSDSDDSDDNSVFTCAASTKNVVLLVVTQVHVQSPTENQWLCVPCQTLPQIPPLFQSRSLKA